MLVTSIFSFSHNVFKRHLILGRRKSQLFGKELSHILMGECNTILSVYTLYRHLG